MIQAISLILFTQVDEQYVCRRVDDVPNCQGDDAPVHLPSSWNVVRGKVVDAGIPIIHGSKRTLVVSSWIGAHVVGRVSGDVFLDDVCVRLDLESLVHHAWSRQLNTERQGTVLLNDDACLWILGMKTEKVGTIIHNNNGGSTDPLGCPIYSNRVWHKSMPAFIIEASTANLCGLNESNFNRSPCSYWFLERQVVLE